jgi:carboxymethylenebutenolidase
MSHTIQLTGADGHRFPVYVAEPATNPRAAVIVLQEIFGVNSHIREVAESYAQAGYLALAPSTFHRSQAGVELGYTPEDVNTGRELKGKVEALPAPGVMQDIQATIDHAHAVTGGKIAVLGYCWGGLLSWRAAELCSGLSAVVPYYGGGMTIGGELLRQPKCPVLCHFGEQDMGIPLDTVQVFAKTYATAQPKVQVITYPANHGFHCNQRGSFDAASAKLAHERTLAFLAEQLAA